MQPFSLCYYSATAIEIPSLSEGVSLFQKYGGTVKVTARTQVQLFDKARQKAFIKDALKNDVLIISLHGGKASFPAFELLAEQLELLQPEQRPLIHIQPTSGDEDSIEAAREFCQDFGTPDWDLVKQYISAGGHINFHQLLVRLHNRLFATDLHCEPPTPLPDDGIYHPDYAGIPRLERYLSEKIDTDKITVGLWFYQTYWVNNNLAFIDAIIREIEAAGANVIPVFHHRYKDAERQNNGADYVVQHYFMDGDKPRIQALINPQMFSLTLVAKEYQNLLSQLGVPFIQAMTCSAPYQQWNESIQGLPTMDVSYSAAQPEFDGALITVPVATREQETVDPVTGALMAKYHPIPERVGKMVRLTLNWGRLSRIPNSERRVAIIFHHYPPRNDRIGCAAGLDSFASVSLLMDRMRAAGYQLEHTYPDHNELSHALLEKMTCDQRWLTPDQMAARAEADAGREEYTRWHAELPQAIQEKMRNDWGTVPGDLFVHDDKMHFAGLRNGNIFLTIQPPRGYLEQIDAIYHDMYLSPPHHYLAQYRWIRDIFKAHVVMHVGKHGSLEWLPGKALGLSDHCYPDLAIMELPNVYPYIINDPGEGTQAKRRSYCCIIDHLTPAFTNADLYDDLAKVQELVLQYQMAVSEDPGKVPVLQPMIWEAVAAADLDKDLEISEQEAMDNFDRFLETLHAYVEELGDTMINDGLHTFGQPPEGKRLTEFLVQLTRLPNGSVPSLRESLVSAMGCDYDDVLEHRGVRQPHFGNRTGGEVLRNAHNQALELVDVLEQNNFSPESVPPLLENIPKISRSSVEATLKYITDSLVPNIIASREEINAAMDAFAGSFVPPGPSGSPTRGQADILPTGRNFYSVDPNKIPTPAAWEVGVRLGDALIERYLKETGRYPDTIGILVYGTVTMRTRGDDIAEIYYLMGLKPVWQKGSGNVCGLEVIPLEELGRPRLDVSPRVSGFFRDSFPNLMERIDEAVRIVSALKEAPESNFVRRNVYKDVAEYKKQGMSEEEALREATFRVFGCPPGTYGAGVSELIESKNWKTQEDLGNNYIRYSSHAYGQGSYGTQKPENFKRVLSRMDVTVKNEDSREYDMMSCTDYYNYYGGLIVAAKTVRGSLPFAVMGDSSDPKRVKVRTTFEEAKHVLRSRLVNPKWLEGMKRHGYKGAGDISHMMDVVLGWDATGEVIEDWMYAKIAQAYALDPEMQQWMKEVNPYALQNILDKLLEAISRGMWNADESMEQDLRDAYLEMEGEIEEWTE
ncbi:cobaltochelatase subunit CobN [Desulfogranum japonicum]|uniref:cobaltochelatase subunit CobN n=1 Tax=Desulfogranum japonicum TaxID=231447 RepID=UPI0004298032